jgi:aminoglycoside phosphotransferase (APT) family kinase protein
LLSGGTQNQIYKISRGELRCAMRIPPPSAPTDRDAGILREWRIIDALTGTDVPCPRAVARCADTAVLGRPFYLMGFVDGWSPMDQREWPAPYDTDRGARQGLAYQMAEGIALLSKVDTVGDPKLDLGWMLQRWPDGTGSAGAAFPFADLSGMPRQSELGPSYRAQRFGRREAGGAHRRVQSGNSADDGAGHAAQGRKQQRLGQELFDGHSLEIELATP